MIPEYAIKFNPDPVWGGDSLPDLSFRLEDSSGNAIVPLGVCAQILSRFGEQIFEWDVSIESDGLVILSKVMDTSFLSEGRHRYTVTYILEDGWRRTYFEGIITILKRVPQCLGDKQKMI